MIRVTRLNNSVLYLNAEMIETIEATPDTIIKLTNKIKVVVKESPEVIVERIVEYQRKVHNRLDKYLPGE